MHTHLRQSSLEGVLSLGRDGPQGALSKQLERKRGSQQRPGVGALS